MAISGFISVSPNRSSINRLINVDLQQNLEMSAVEKIDPALINMAMENASYDKDIKLTIHTNKGDIKLNLFATKTPKTVCNFIELTKAGYYDNLTFHRVIPEFMVQGGCPLGRGHGGPGYNFEDEFHPDLQHDGPGVLSMANAGPNTNGSQFFITHIATPWLDNNHTVFGKVIDDSDMEVVNDIRNGDEIISVEIHD